MHKIKKYFQHKAIVLMYHRIAELQSDVWNITVSTANFEQHLQLLKKTERVITLKDLVKDVQNKSVKKNCIAITFDDGYADNFHRAKPLLEKYQLPATFFIASENITCKQEFWWDELEHLLLFTEKLPPLLSIIINETKFEFDLKDESTLTDELVQKNELWKAFEQEPPTLRCEVFLRLWQELKPLPAEQQQRKLEVIRKWAGKLKLIRPEYICISPEQLKGLATNNLFDVGAHTVTHLSLPFHNKTFQKKELLDNKTYLENLTGKKIEFLAYPYGDYNENTISAANDVGFQAAFTTGENIITHNSEHFQLARFQVKNQHTVNFEKTIKGWLNM